MVCKIICCSEFSNILDKAGRKTRRRRTQAIAKPYAFHANATMFTTLRLHLTIFLLSAFNLTNISD